VFEDGEARAMKYKYASTLRAHFIVTFGP